MSKIPLLALSLVMAFPFLIEAQEIRFVEDFALSPDRPAALKQLIPGTEDYYYYHALHYLNTEQFDKAAADFPIWLERFGQSQRLTEIQTRHALLTYQRDPQKALAYLRSKLNLQFNHQRPAQAGVAPNLPTALDPALIARDRLRGLALARSVNLDFFEDSALEWLSPDNLDVNRLRNYLQRLQRPDIANLPAIVAQELRTPNNAGFGAFPIHAQMTQTQLEELLRLRPDLLNQSAFVNIWMSKLQPGADDNWRRNPALTRAYLDRLLEFTRRLAPAHNSLKANILYQRLVFDRTQGQYDKELFLEYLKLPRFQPYMARRMLESQDLQRVPADLNADYSGATLLPPIRTDEPLVRDYLKRFLKDMESPQPYEPYINDVYLKHLFAETKIEAGLGDPERWASELPPDAFARLKERIDIDFAHSNKTNFGADEKISLDLFVKNVPTLIVKVFEVNTGNFYRTQLREIDTDVTLDGLVANSEQTMSYTEPPLRRMERKFEFPQLTKPGVYVIDFIGSGRSSRALVRKGRLRPLTSTSTAGHIVRVVDDQNRLVTDASVWLGGKEYAPDKDGTVLVPFSTAPGRQPIVIRRGEFASLDYLQHDAEQYSLTAGLHVDREALLAQRLAVLTIRPGLMLNGQPVSTKLLTKPKLQISATDRDGIVTNMDVPEINLFEDRETTHEFRVPARLASLSATFSAEVESLSTGQKVRLQASQQFTLNGIDATDKIEDLHLAKFGTDYAVELFGRTGEVKPDRAVQISLKHRDFRDPVNVSLKTDARGRVSLGTLPDIVSVTATGPEGTSHTWRLPEDRCTYRHLLHAKLGTTVTLPYLGSAGEPVRRELALFQTVGLNIKADRFDALAIKDGLIELRGLPAGDYDLWLKMSGERIRIRIVDGAEVAGHVLGAIRHLELAPLKPVQIQSITSNNDSITIQLKDASKFARVHVFASRYVPAYSAFGNLSRVRAAELRGVYPGSADSVYLTGRNIGDEYRYVLDRKQQKKYAGNMLERPMLLLNPWAVRSTETGEQLAAEGAAFGGVGGAVPPAASPAAPARSNDMMRMSVDAGAFANLDFLADPAAVGINLVPDDKGVVTIPRRLLGPKSMVHVVAVDPLHTVSKLLTLPEAATDVLDLRLSAGLDPKGHFTQQKQVSVLPAGQPFILADAAGSRFETYDSLAKLHALFATLTKDPRMGEFAFLLNWPKLKPEEKQSLYSKHACHELNFFLSRKDAAFFNAVVKPYLANKKDKTFLDHYLLDGDLTEYVKPWRYGRLNTVERILLAQKLPGEAAKTARFLADIQKMQPVNLDRDQQLFEFAIKTSELSKGRVEIQAMGDERAKQQLGVLRATGSPDAGLPGATGAAGFGGGGRGGAPGAPPAGGNFAGRPMAPKGAAGPAPAKDAPKMDADFKSRDGAAKKELESLEKKLAEPGDAGKDKNAELFFMEERARRSVATLYRKIEPTQEWAENNYDKLPIQQQVAELITGNPFWLDFVKHEGNGPFLSKHVNVAARNFPEAMLALAVTDLPFEAGKHEIKFDAGRMTLTPAGPAIVFHEEVKPVGAAAAKLPILVSQNIYRHNDRYREENGERLDKFITEEFVIHTVYGMQVVVTNPSPSRQKLAVLVQIPVGSIPLAGARPTRTILIDLEPYRTQTIDVLFYFPKAGRYDMFPVHVAKNEQLVATAAPFSFNVLEKPSKLDTTSWDYVAQFGTDEEVLAFMARENIHALPLHLIAFRMKDAKFYEAATALIQDRHAYNDVLWSYGLQHNAVSQICEFLLHHPGMAGLVGGPIDSPLYSFRPVDHFSYEHLEYKPLINARAHSLGQRRQIVNNRLNEQYHRLMTQLSYRRELNDDDRLAVTYYLLLQDRIGEALAQFAKVSADRVATKLQYDYCAAYLALYEDDAARVRAIAMKHANHPVDRWKKTFEAVIHTLDEAEGKGPKVADAENQAQKQAQLAAQEPSFEFTIEKKTIELKWQNLEAVTVNYYLMDVELLFSRNPFVQQTASSQFSMIRPNATKEIRLPANQKTLAVPLPDDLAGRNVLVEIVAAGKTKAVPYYANAMDVNVIEQYGQVKVTNATTGKPLAKVYVKAYVRTQDGQVKFHRDGYTDIRGRFDFATVSTPEKSAPQRFSVLVLSDEFGAVIREAAPPPQ